MSLIDKNSHVLAAPLEKSFHYGEETLIEAFVTTDSSPTPREQALVGNAVQDISLISHANGYSKTLFLCSNTLNLVNSNICVNWQEKQRKVREAPAGGGLPQNAT